MKPTCLLLALLVILSLGSTGCRPPETGVGGRGPGGMATPVVTAEAIPQPVAETITLIGTVAANEAVDVKSETDGLVEEIPFLEGQDVVAGQLLVRLDETKPAAVLAEAEASFRLGEATFARSQQLFQEKLISQQEFDQVAATFARNRASVELMKRQLKDARIYAPFAGTVGARNISPGQVISRNTVLTSLVDLDPVKVEFYVPERFLSQVAVGQTIAIRVAAFPERTFSGEVYFVAAQLDAETRKALVKARIPNPNRELKPGMFANLDLTLTLRDRAIVIPEIAVLYDGDQARVFVVDSNQVAVLRPVQVGLRLPGLAEIVGGLQAGERVVVEGTQKVVPGAKVSTDPPPGPGVPGAGASSGAAGAGAPAQEIGPRS
ncbi:MAG: efflux RND transporter periplasmic adaptor subunit [Verrucomicrobia bacterium]|nr:efflux RND transporter periplasmic adaptor subunit [Verrucomicrobiota bacterium]